MPALGGEISGRIEDQLVSERLRAAPPRTGVTVLTDFDHVLAVRGETHDGGKRAKFQKSRTSGRSNARAINGSGGESAINRKLGGCGLRISNCASYTPLWERIASFQSRNDGGIGRAPMRSTAIWLCAANSSARTKAA